MGASNLCKLQVTFSLPLGQRNLPLAAWEAVRGCSSPVARILITPSIFASSFSQNIFINYRNSLDFFQQIHYTIIDRARGWLLHFVWGGCLYNLGLFVSYLFKTDFVVIHHHYMICSKCFLPIDFPKKVCVEVPLYTYINSYAKQNANESKIENKLTQWI